MKLQVPMVWQKRDSADCGLAMTAMIMRYHGDHVTVNSLKKQIKVYKGGTWEPQWGMNLLGCGYSVTIVSQDCEVFTLKDRNKSQEDLARKLRRLEQKAREENKRSGDVGFSYPLQRVFGFYASFIEQGGYIKVKVPTEEDIRMELKAGRPVGASISSCFLKYDTPQHDIHAIIIVGMDRNKIIVQDPYPDSHGGLQKYHIDDFMYGLHAANGGDLLCARKNS